MTNCTACWVLQCTPHPTDKLAAWPPKPSNHRTQLCRPMHTPVRFPCWVDPCTDNKKAAARLSWRVHSTPGEHALRQEVKHSCAGLSMKTQSHCHGSSTRCQTEKKNGVEEVVRRHKQYAWGCSGTRQQPTHKPFLKQRAIAKG